MNLEKLYLSLTKINVKEDSKENFEKILKELEIDILANGKVNTSCLSAFKRLIKTNLNRPDFSVIFKNKENTFCCTNGYFLIDFKQDIENVPSTLKAYIDDRQKDKMTISFETLSNKNAEKLCKIDIEKIDKIIKFNKIKKNDLSNDKLLYKVENTYFQAEFLKDMLAIADLKVKDSIFCYVNERDMSGIQPINFNFENCDMILLPIRVQNDKNKIERQKELCKQAGI